MTPVNPASNPDGSRPGRIWVILILAAAIGALAIGIIGISTQEPGEDFKNVIGAGDSRQIFGGVRQLDDRLGSDDAPIQIQVFADVQSSTYQEQFLDTIPPVVTRQVRDGDVKLLLRNRSLTRNATELSFYGVEAAAKQGYGWQYAYLMVRNQEEAEKRRLNEEFLQTLAEAVEKMDQILWKEDFEEGIEPGSEIDEDLIDQDKLAIQLGIRDAPAFVVTGPGGTEVLQDGPDLDALQLAIDKVR